MITPIAAAIRNENFTADQKSLYTSFRRTCLVWAGRGVRSASLSATLSLCAVSVGRLGLFTELICRRLHGGIAVTGNRDDSVTLREASEDHTHRVASLRRNFGDVGPHDLTALEH